MVLLRSVTKYLLHLSALLLGSREVAQALLAVLQGTLLLANTQELLHALLQRGQTNKIGNDRLHRAQALVGGGVAIIGRRLAGTASGDMALVEASNDAGTGGDRSHCVPNLSDTVHRHQDMQRKKRKRKRETK